MTPLCQQLDERSFWVLLEDLEDKDNTKDFKELLGWLSMFCNDCCAKASPDGTEPQPVAQVKPLSPPQTEPVCIGDTRMGMLGTPRKPEMWGTLQ